MLTPDEELLNAAQPSWVKTDALAKDLYELKSTTYGASPGGSGRSGDYPFSPLLQKPAPILTQALTPQSGGGLDADTIQFVVPSNGAFGVIDVFLSGEIRELP